MSVLSITFLNYAIGSLNVVETLVQVTIQFRKKELHIPRKLSQCWWRVRCKPFLFHAHYPVTNCLCEMPKSFGEQHILTSTIQLTQEIFKNLSQSRT